jgi:hypothetical protein
MGLDMYLTGDKYFRGPRERGDRKSEQYDLGYWRKHPNLHGYIVKTFADGVDECQEIDLPADRIRQIIEAVKDRQLPETTGFFFGTSDDTDEQIAHDVEIFEEALKWLETVDSDVWRSVSYRASW